MPKFKQGRKRRNQAKPKTVVDKKQTKQIKKISQLVMPNLMRRIDFIQNISSVINTVASLLPAVNTTSLFDSIEVGSSLETNTRIGSTIFLRGMQFRGILTNTSAQPSQQSWVNIKIFYCEYPQGKLTHDYLTDTFRSSELLPVNPNNVYSLLARKRPHVSNMKVYLDRNFLLAGNSVNTAITTTKPLEFSFNLGRKVIQYDNLSLSSPFTINKGGLYIMVTHDALISGSANLRCMSRVFYEA